EARSIHTHSAEKGMIPCLGKWCTPQLLLKLRFIDSSWIFWQVDAVIVSLSTLVSLGCRDEK
ncbi:hypothetical protein DSO57_1004470, partial [Entomophthora muscae]